MSMVVARFSNEVAFSSVYIYSSELFPTTLRLVDKSCLHAADKNWTQYFHPLLPIAASLYSFLRDILILDTFFED